MPSQPVSIKNLLGKSLAALPAALALLLTVTVFFMARLGTATPGIGELKERVAAALRQGELREAELWARNALQKAPGQMELRMQLMEAYAGMGNRAERIEQLKQLAPDDHVGYAPAHLLRARLILARGRTTSGELAEAQNALDLALQAKPGEGQGTVDPAEVAVIKAEIAAAGGEWAKALAAANEVASPAPGTLLVKANALKALDQPREAAAAADAAIAELEKSVTGSTLEDRLLRLTIRAKARILKGEIGEALEAGRAEADASEPPLRALRLDICVNAARSCRSGPDKDSRLWLEALAEGLELAPDDLGLTTELLVGTALWQYQPGFFERFAERFASGPLLGLRELIDGIITLQGGDPGGAFQHFERGYAVLPGNPLLANNLAAILGTRPLESDPTRALEIIDRVLNDFPGVGVFLDTKGQILLRMGRNADALAPLEAALKATPSPATHLVLAEAYSRLGQTTLAERHRKAAAGR